MMTKIREGYKETEIGVIPEDWEVTRIIDLADKSDRYSFTGGPFGSDLKSSDYTVDGIRVIQLQNIGDGKFYNDSKIYTSVEKANELSNSNIFPNELILAKMADPVARACKIPEFHSRYVMCSDGIRLKVNPMKYDTDYCLYSINSTYFRKKAIENSTGTTRLRIGLSALKELEIATPPLPEQQRIAEILSTTDSHIEKLDKIIEDYQLLKKGMMKKLLTEGIGHTEFKETEIGRIPKEWEVKYLGEFIQIKTGGTPSRSNLEYWENGQIPWMASGDVNYGVIRHVDGRITEEGLKNSAAKLLPINTVMIALNGQGKTKGMVAIIKIETTCNQSLAGFLPSKFHYPEFLYYSLKRRYLEIRGIVGDARSGLNMEHLKNIKIALPPLSEQIFISEILTDIDKEIEVLQFQKDDFYELKKSLMEKLLTGRVRVNTTELGV